MPDDCFKNVEHVYYSNTKEAYASMYSEKLKDFYDYKTINKHGKVSPLNRDIIKKG